MGGELDGDTKRSAAQPRGGRGGGVCRPLADAVGAGPHDTSATTTRYSLRAGWGPVFSAVEIFRVFSITPAHRLVYTSGGGLCHHCIYSLGKDTFENATAFTSLPSRRFTEGFPGCP